MGLFDSTYAQDLAAIQARQTSDARVAYAATQVNPALAQGVVAQSQAYPWIAPQTAYALAANGNTPGDAVSHTVATGVLNHHGGGFWSGLGHMVTAPLRSAIHLGAAGVSDVQYAGKVAARIGLTAAETPLQVLYGAGRDVASAAGSAGDIVAGALAGAGTGAATAGIAGGALGSVVPGLGNLVGAVGGVLGGAVIGGAVGAAGGAMAQSHGVEIKGGFVNPLAQSSGGVAVGQLLSGHGVDLGSGFLPGGTVHEQMVKNAQDAASINGHALTPGRMLASAVAAPGSKPYNLLSGITDAIDTWELDPTRYVAKEVEAERAARKLINPAAVQAGPLAGVMKYTPLAKRAGLLDAAAPAISDVAHDFVTSDPAARNFIDKVAGLTSPSEIRAATNNKLPVVLAKQLAAVSTPQDVEGVLRNAIEEGALRERQTLATGGRISDTLDTFRQNSRLGQLWETKIGQPISRLGDAMPKGSIDLIDADKPGAWPKLDKAADQLDAWMKQARLSPEIRKGQLDKFIMADNKAGMKNVLEETVNTHLRQRLGELGWDNDTIDKALGSWTDVRDSFVDQLHNELGQDRTLFGARIADRTIPMAKANETLEALDNVQHLPDPRTVRQLTTPKDTPVGRSLANIYNSDAWKNSTAGMDWFMGKLWKPLNIARPALAARMLTMESVKMAAHGYESPLTSPLSLIASLVTGKGAGYGEATSATGELMSRLEEHAESMSGFTRSHPGNLTTAFQKTLSPADDTYAHAWGSQLIGLNRDPVARSIAANGYQATADAFWDGPLAAHREKLAGILSNDRLATRAGADDFVHNIVGSHYETLTAGNPTIAKAVATGTLEHADGSTPLATMEGGRFLHPDTERQLGLMGNDTTVTTPAMVKGARAPEEVDADYGIKLSKATRWLYGTLITAPMNTLVRSPEFNQAYWKAMAEAVPHLSEDGAAALRASMASSTAKITDDTRSLLERNLDRLATSGHGPSDLKDVDLLARAQAVDSVHDMTIDMTHKQGWQDANRLMMPFAKHWQQELGQWARIGTEHPDAFRKAQIAVEGAQGSGWFHQDDQGAWVFNYPGSGIISNLVTGTPGGMTAKVSGLAALTGSLLPSFGPVVSIPASKILPNRPEWDEVRNFMFPQGDPTQGGVANAILPPWAKTVQKALADPSQDRDAGNTTMQVARYLVSTGKFNTNTPEDIDKLLKESGSRAKKLLGLQAIGKFVLPSSPSLEPMAEDKDGRTVVAKILSKDLQQMRKDDFEHATENFLAKYGDQAMLFLQGTTRAIVPGGATTKEESDFARANPDVVKALPNTYALFAPQGGQTPDYTAIVRQLHTGERQALTPKQQIALANDQVASMQYYTVKDALGPRVSSATQALLSQYKDLLAQQYPGFNTIITGLAARPMDKMQNISDVVIPELQKSLSIDKIANSETGQALASYLGLRDVVDSTAQARGMQPGSFASATKAADLRAALRQAATILGQNNPGFSVLFDRVLARELHTDTSPASPAAPGAAA